MGKLKNDKDEVTGERIKGEGYRVVDWISEDWKSAVIVPLYKGKGERTECRNYTGISLLSVFGKMQEVTESFRAGRVSVDQIFTLNQIDEKV